VILPSGWRLGVDYVQSRYGDLPTLTATRGDETVLAVASWSDYRAALIVVGARAWAIERERAAEHGANEEAR